jgi:hypothetical protein
VVSLGPQVAASNLASLIYNGTFTRFPRLRVVLAGFGFTWAASFLWRADAEWRNLRGEVPWLTQSPTEVVAEHIRFVFDAAADVPAGEAGAKLVGLVPPASLLWGSDRPFVTPDPSESLAALPTGLAQRLVGDNARATFSRFTPMEVAP